MTEAPYPPIDGTEPCRQTDPELFFPTDNDREAREETRRAIRACHDCWIQTECKAYALSQDVHGIWGGTTRKQRLQEQKDAGIALVDQVHRQDHGSLPALIARLDNGSRTPKQIADELNCSVKSVERFRATRMTAVAS